MKHAIRAGRRSAAAFACTAALAIGGASAALPFWTADGGTPQRTSAASLDTDITQFKAHWTATFSSNVEDTISEVEGYLLQSPLVTSTDYIVVGSDDCTISLLPDPIRLSPGQPWIVTGGLGSTYKWKAPQQVPGAPGECVMSGIALDNSNGLYMLDGRNEILYKLQYTIQRGFGSFPVVWNTTFKGHPLKFELDVSMIFVPGSDPVYSPGWLWVPLAASLMGNSGVAAAVNPIDGTYYFIGLPDNDCRPDDFGSAALMKQGIALLGATDCGLMTLDGSSSPPSFVFKSYPSMRPMLFSQGEHSHPIFDAGTNNLYWFDWAADYLIRQQVCCMNLNSYAECGRGADGNGGWSATCTKIPELDSQDGPEGTYYDRWEWIAGALSGNYLYVAVSGPINDEVIINGIADLRSGLLVWDTTTGVLVAQHMFGSDMFNSAPLAVTGSTGNVRVYVMTTGGQLYCYAGGLAVGNGPLWVSADVTPIPPDDLPLTTYSFLSLTPSGTIMVTASAGGADWNDEKVYYGIVNGVYSPVAPATAGLTPGAIAGITIVMLGVLGAGFGFAYFRVPAFNELVNMGTESVASAVSGVTSSVRGAAGGYSKPMGSMSASGSSSSGGYSGFGSTAPAEGSGLLSSAYQSGGSAGAAPMFGGSSFNGEA